MVNSFVLRHVMILSLTCGMVGSLSIQAGVSPILDEDFQADTAGLRPSANMQFAVYSRPASGDTATTIVQVIDGSPEIYGPFRRMGNRSLKIVALTTNDAPSFFIKNKLLSGITATNDGRFSARLWVQQPQVSTVPMLKLSVGRDNSSNSALDTTEQVAQVDVLANGYLQIRTGNGIFTSDQTFAYEKSQTLVVDFSTGANGTFTVQLDGTPITANGNATFTAQSSTANANAVFVVAQAATGTGTTAYVDNVFLTDSRGLTYYVAPNGNNSYAGTDPNFPLLTPKAAMTRAKPGDTLQIASGTYRMADTLNQFNKTTTPSTRITVLGEPDQSTLLTTMEDLQDPAKWAAVPSYPHVYEHNGTGEIPGDSSSPLYRCATQDGWPLRMMTPNDGVIGSPADLTGPGQWSRDSSVGKIYVWAYDGQNPGRSATEVSRRYATVYLFSNDSNGTGGNNHITLQNLTVEGSYYPIYTSGNDIEIIHCKVGKAFADCIKSGTANSGSLVENCNLYHMGESGVDATQATDWTIRGNHIHDGWSNRSYGSKVNGIMLKFGVEHIVAEENIITNLNAEYGGITLGGSSDGSPAIEAQYLTVRNNIMSYITGRYIVTFMSAQDCTFTGNTIVRCQVEHASVGVMDAGLILWASNDGTNNTHPSQNNTITNNILYDANEPNEADYTYMEYASNNHSGTISGNVVNPSRKHLISGVEVSTGYFPDDLDPQ